MASDAVGLCSLAIPFPSKATQIPDERLGPRLADQEELLTTEEQEELLARLDEISERQQCDVVIVTVASIEGKTATEYADDYFDYQGYGYGEKSDGILLLVGMKERVWAISTHGSLGISGFYRCRTGLHKRGCPVSVEAGQLCKGNFEPLRVFVISF